MAKLIIWNENDEVVLEDSQEFIDVLEELLEDYKDENNLYSSGGLGYDIKIHTNDDLLMLKDDLEDEAGEIVGRYKLSVY